MIKRSLLILVVWIFLLSFACGAEVYISAEEAAKKIFPDYQEYRIENHALDNQEVKVFTIFKDQKIVGWAVVLDEKGKIKPITFLVGIDTKGKVLEAYVLEFRDLFGSEIKRRSFLRQFHSKSLDDPIAIGRDIDAVTQATISSHAAASAVKKALRVTEELRKGF